MARPRLMRALTTRSRSGARREGDPLPRGYWNDEERCVAAIARFLGGLGPGDDAGRLTYFEWARHRADQPKAT
jgi:hypothetical protein